MSTVSDFMEEHFRHFNARETLQAAKAYRNHILEGGQMVVSIAGAMSTAEIGRSLAPMIRLNKVHAICCTAANLEEEVYNMFAHKEYVRKSDYQDISAVQETELRDRGLNRITDTCIPESIMLRIEGALVESWSAAARGRKPRFAWNFISDLLGRPEFADSLQVSPEHCWALAAKECGVPVFTPGFEDSTLGCAFCAKVMEGLFTAHHVIRSGTEMLQELALWYLERAKEGIPVGFFQIGGGIAGDFAVSVVPMLKRDLKENVPYWAYYAQITDSTTSYGSYSGAPPNEKITWSKIDANTPSFAINSDATLVVPLIFEYVLAD